MSGAGGGNSNTTSHHLNDPPPRPGGISTNSRSHSTGCVVRQSLRDDFAKYRLPRPSIYTQQIREQKQQERQQQQQELLLGQQQQEVDHSSKNDTTINFMEYDYDDDDFMLQLVHGSCQQYFLCNFDTEQQQKQNQNQSFHQNNNKNHMINLHQQQQSNPNSTTSATHLCGPTNIFLSCQEEIDHHLDLFTHCRQPLSFLSILDPTFDRTHPTYSDDNDEDDDIDIMMLPPGTYLMPKECEYCGSPNIKHCSDTCTRPKLFFQKKCPPFVQPDPIHWQPGTEHYIEPIIPIVQQQQPPTPLFNSNSNKKGKQQQQSNNTHSIFRIGTRTTTTTKDRKTKDQKNQYRPLSPSILLNLPNPRYWVSELFHPTNTKPTTTTSSSTTTTTSTTFIPVPKNSLPPSPPLPPQIVQPVLSSKIPLDSNTVPVQTDEQTTS